MNHGVQADLYVRYRQFIVAAYLPFISDAPSTAIYVSTTWAIVCPCVHFWQQG